jgi:hypothetical protein
MKRITLTVAAVCLMSLSALAQSNKFFRIDYGIKSGESDAQMDDTQLRAWVNQDYMRIAYTQDESHIEIKDKKKIKSFILVPNSQEYLILQDGTKNDYSDVQIEYVNGQEKNIAGYTCKLAIINIGTDEESGEEVKLAVYYTEQIPNLSWAEFNFLETLPGAPLSITVSGDGYIAQKIDSEELAQELFEIPESYTEMEADSAVGYSDIQVADNRFIFTNETGDLYGLKDENEEIILQPKYTHIAPFDGEISIVNDVADKFGAINLAGKEIITLKHDFLNYSDASKTFIYGEQDKYGLLRADGSVLIKATYDMVDFPENGLIQFMKNDKSGFMNEKEQIIIPAVHEHIFMRNKDYFITFEGTTYSLLSIKDNKKIAGGYEYMALPDEGNAFLAMKNGKYGYIDEKGQTIIPFKFSTALAFENGVAIVSEDEAGENIYYIDTKGEEVAAIEAE